jgi:hypothetical protein
MAINCEAKTHVIDGVTYVEVDRKAEVGDTVIVFGSDICEITDVWSLCDDDVYKLKRPGGKDLQSWFDAECIRVLEPIQEETTEASPAIIEMLTSLSRKIVSLESQLRDTQNNLEKQAEELANTRHRLAKHADRFAAIEDKVEMLTDDIVDLDSRSQVLNAINKYYAEGSR